MSKIIFVVLSAALATAWGYSAGAPETVCDDMTPKHPVEPQTTTLPYSVTISKKEVKAGDTLDITISGKTFKGFLVQVRDGNDKAVGSFDLPDTDRYAKAINCHGSARDPGRWPPGMTFPASLWARESGATHKNAVDKKDFVLKWKAPKTTGIYQVYVTIAEDGGTFWARRPSEKIKVY